MTIPDWFVTGGVVAFGWVAGTSLALCLVIGILGAIIQTTTQIRETAIAFVPKALGLIILIALGGGLIMHNLEVYTTKIYHAVPAILHPNLASADHG